MAAKVVMVAVPTVMGMASIRVYTVSDVPTDGLVSRQKLNIYTPLLQSAQAQFDPESPGVIESAVTAARETILPLVQAVKGACFSVKTGTVNVYHAGEDVYYYLKDPPPGFLPRFGTITMAGLLGMFLARKGSHFKRLAVPLGLMSAGASVCYPAQTVAVLKVTGKKVYAVGQWSSTAVSSLLPSKSQEPVAKEIVASPPQTVPKPECAGVEEASETSSAQSSLIPEPEVESAESVPLSDEPVVAVITEEASTVILKETASDQPTNTDPVAHSVSTATETTTTSEDIPAPVESEEPSDPKQAAEDVSSSAQPTQSLEPAIAEAAPEEAAQAEAAPAEAAPVESAPAEAAPVESAPVEAAPVESAPLESAPLEAAQVEAAPVESAPVESAPVESAPVEAVPVEAALVEAAPVEAAPVESAPVESAPVEAVPVEAALVEAAPVEAAPVESAPVESAPVEAVPVEAAPVESAPMEAAPVESQETLAPKASDKAEVPVVESVEQEPAAQPELAKPPQVAAENSKDGSSFKPDPALMDFGQSNPEDEDLYSTRS